MSRRSALAALLAITLLAVTPGDAYGTYRPGLPPGIDPGTPVFSGPQNPVPAQPVAFDPSKSMLGRIYDADIANGGNSFWFDRMLERPFGSVRWKEDTPDRAANEVLPVVATAAGSST